MKNSFLKKFVCLAIVAVSSVFMSKAAAEPVLLCMQVESKEPIHRGYNQASFVLYNPGFGEAEVQVERSVKRYRRVPREDYEAPKLGHAFDQKTFFDDDDYETEDYFITPILYECDRSEAENWLRRGDVHTNLLLVGVPMKNIILKERLGDREYECYLNMSNLTRSIKPVGCRIIWNDVGIFDGESSPIMDQFKRYYDR